MAGWVGYRQERAGTRLEWGQWPREVEHHEQKARLLTAEMTFGCVLYFIEVESCDVYSFVPACFHATFCLWLSIIRSHDCIPGCEHTSVCLSIWLLGPFQLELSQRCPTSIFYQQLRCAMPGRLCSGSEDKRMRGVKTNELARGFSSAGRHWHPCPRAGRH